MTTSRARQAVSISRLVAAGLASLAALGTASASFGAGGDDDREGVLRFRRSGAAGDASSVSSVSVTRRTPPIERSLSTQGQLLPDSPGGGGAGPDAPELATIEDTDPERPGLPDAEPGDRTPPQVEESFSFYDIGVRGKRVGRVVKLVGAEFVFANVDIDVAQGLPLGYTGVRGSVGSAPGSASLVEFEVASGGELVLTVQPASASLSTPSRPVRTVTMVVP